MKVANSGLRRSFPPEASVASPRGIDVSRITSPSLSWSLDLSRKALPRKTGRDVLFGPPAIEHTVRARDAVQTSPDDVTAPKKLVASMSAPVLSHNGSMARVMLPRIGKAIDRAPTVGKMQPPGEPRERQIAPVISTDKDWVGPHLGDHRLEIPFSRVGEDTLSSDQFIRTYRSAILEDNLANSQGSVMAMKVGNVPTFRPSVLPWGAEHRLALHKLRQSQPGSGQAKVLQGQAILYRHLDEHKPMRGRDALAAAIAFRVGDADTAMRVLDCGEKGELGLMEFVGAMSILNLDLEVLCGADDVTVFQHLDTRRRGTVRLQQLVHPTGRSAFQFTAFSALTAERKKAAPFSAQSASSSNNTGAEKLQQAVGKLKQKMDNIGTTEEAHVLRPDIQRARSKWAAVARWMSTAAQRSAAVRLERLRCGWQLQGADSVLASRCDLASKEEPAEEAEEDAGPTPFLTAAAGDPGAGKQVQFEEPGAPPAVSMGEILLTSAAVMRDQDRPLRSLFIAYANEVLPDQKTKVMLKSELHEFFEDLGKGDALMVGALPPESVDKLYDDIVKLQCEFTRIGTGLSFWSFKAVLNNSIDVLGLGWNSLTNFAIKQSIKSAKGAS